MQTRSQMDFSATPKGQLIPAPPAAPEATQKHVLVCQNRTCLQQGAVHVLAAFQTHPVPGCTVIKTGCMGQCGNGPMVRILPDNIWYCHVAPDEVVSVVERHLRGGRPVRAMLSPHFHTKSNDQPYKHHN